MTNLGIAGAVSLGTVNQWISLIDTNLTNSKRIGYKETRVSMTSGEVNTIGMTQGPGKIMPIAFPSASLLIGKTQILDYVQGNLTQTGQITDFALNGRGYFVVEDKLGNKYATRDGQFNFDADGYLVTQEGLRVLTTGMDYFRVPASESFAVNSEGESKNNVLDSNNITTTFNPAANVASLSTSLYGNKKFLVIDITDADKLVYSKYGYTKFDIGTRIPIKINNDFSEVTDGIDTSLIPDSLVDTGFTTGTVPSRKMANYFRHDLKNGVLKMSTHDVGGTQNRYVQAALTSQKLGNFDASISFNIRDTGFSSFNSTFGLTIGKDDHTVTDATGGTFVGISNNQLVIRKGTTNIATSGLFSIIPDSLLATSLNPNNTLTLRIITDNGNLEAQIYRGNNFLTSITANNINTVGYAGIGTSTRLLTSSSANSNDNIVDITKIHIIENNKDSEYTTNIIQQNVKDIERDGINAQERETMVMQQYVEESTSTLADTLPLLSHAQKMFSAISKVISVYNSITDDMNNTVR